MLVWSGSPSGHLMVSAAVGYLLLMYVCILECGLLLSSSIWLYGILLFFTFSDMKV